MVDFQQLRDADIETVQTHIDGWNNTTSKVTNLEHNARTRVGAKIRDGSWEGYSGRLAASRTTTLEKELAAAKTEADSVKWLLWLLKRNAKNAQDQLKKIIAYVNGQPMLAIDERGTVRVKVPQQGGPEPLHEPAMAAAKKAADKSNEQIMTLLTNITAMDKQLAAKLKAVANLDDAPDDPRFNGNAKQDGYLTTESALHGKYNMPDGTGTPFGESYEGGRTYLKHGDKAYELYKLKKETEELAIQRFGKEGFHNGKADAMKHTLMSAVMASKYGEDVAREITDAHEKLPDNPRNEEVMDLYNNRIGFQIARENPNATPAELARIVEQRVRDGGTLITDKGATGLWYSDGRPIPK